MDADSTLVEAAAAGDRAAFDDLVRRYQARIVGLARMMTGAGNDAEDIAQEVFVRAWRSVSAFRGDSSFRTWLYRIAINVVSTHRGRSSRLKKLFGPAADFEDAERGAVDTAANQPNLEADFLLRDAIDRALAALPEELRMTVVLRDVQGLEYREIAETLGVPMGTVESRIFRARQRLRPLLQSVREDR